MVLGPQSSHLSNSQFQACAGLWREQEALGTEVWWAQGQSWAQASTGGSEEVGAEAGAGEAGSYF